MNILIFLKYLMGILFVIICLFFLFFLFGRGETGFPSFQFKCVFHPYLLKGNSTQGSITVNELKQRDIVT